jgi:signal transduction histidine kinase
MFLSKKDIPLQPNLSLLLSEFNRSLMLIADKTLLINNVIAKTRQLCPVESIHIFLLDRNTGKYNLQNMKEKQSAMLFAEKGKLVSWLSINEKELIVSSNPDIINYLTADEKAILTHLKTEVIYPLIVMNRISGMVLLGKKTNGQPFTAEDTGILSLMFYQAAFAIEHAMLYEQQTDRIRKMYRADRLATLGELAAGAAHEIRNPLTAINSSIQYLSKDFANDPAKSEMIHEILTEVERINKIVQGLLSFARPMVLNKTDVNIEQLINQTLLLSKTAVQKQQIDIQFEYFVENAVIQGDVEQLKQVFLNIIINAIEAMKDNLPEQPRTLIIGIENGISTGSHSRHLLVTFEDTGKGIAENDIENVFNPFFTTKEEGTGLGLAICYGIIDRHQGEIEVKSAAGESAVIQVKLPLRIVPNEKKHDSIQTIQYCDNKSHASSMQHSC